MFLEDILISLNVVSVWLSFKFLYHKNKYTKDLVWKKKKKNQITFSFSSGFDLNVVSVSL